jgi:hypothetical protein
MKKKYYAISIIHRQATVLVDGLETNPVNLCWHEGQYGALPVFTNKRTAQRIAKKLGASTELLVFEDSDS